MASIVWVGTWNSIGYAVSQGEACCWWVLASTCSFSLLDSYSGFGDPVVVLFSILMVRQTAENTKNKPHQIAEFFWVKEQCSTTLLSTVHSPKKIKKQ
jgi:hypothetical protein